MFERFDLRKRARAAGLHLLISLAVAALAAGLVFGLWYPGAYRLMSGGRELFLLVTSVDVVLGPLLTFAVFNLKKGWPHLRRDLAVIGALQLAALAYGLHTVYIARPVALMFEVDRFRVVIAADVHEPELPEAPPGLRTLPLDGPRTLSLFMPEGEERTDALFKAIGGLDLGQRPRYWRPYDDAARAQVLAKARPVKILLEHYPQRLAEFSARLGEARLVPERAKFLPVTARGDWVAVLDERGDVAAFIAADGFF